MRFPIVALLLCGLALVAGPLQAQGLLNSADVTPPVNTGSDGSAPALFSGAASLSAQFDPDFKARYQGDSKGDTREGGETIASAYVISTLPFTDTGATCDNVNDYTLCGAAGGKDVVYRYISPTNQIICISLCGSSFDTVLEIYDGGPGNPIACNDDYCGTQSQLDNVALLAGHTYYFVVDGSGAAACGSYVIAVGSTCACVVSCPPGSIAEGEPACGTNYVDTFNGGCNSSGYSQLSPQSGGAVTVCGKSGTYQVSGIDSRDTDWYRACSQGGLVTATCRAEFPLQLILIYNVDCNNLQYVVSTAAACTPTSVSWTVPAGTTFGIWVGPSMYTGVPCESDYVLEVTGIISCTGACCLNDGSCITTTQANCIQAIGCGRPGAGFQGNGTTCSPNPCTAPAPIGACCFPDGGCVLITSALCTSQGGTYQGNATTCNVNPCPAPAQSAGCSAIIWSQVNAYGPSARYEHAMAYDIDNAKTVLFGGTASVSPLTLLADTWTYDGVNWTMASTSGPSPRSRHCMAYDYDRKRVVLFGGTDGTTRLGDTWEWNGTAWTQVATTGPLPRDSACLAYDSDRKRVVLFGGFRGPGLYSGDTWEWNGVVWVQMNPSGTPGPRYGAAMSYDVNNGNMVLHGGSGTSGSLGDTWLYDGSTWVQEATDGPYPFNYGTSAYDYSCNRVVIYGGAGTPTWQWNGVSWNRLTATGPAGRIFTSVVYDVIRDCGVLFGGYNPGPKCDTWEWRCNCLHGVAEFDSVGNTIVPPWLQETAPEPAQEVPLGLASTLYPCFDTTTDTWISQIQCDPAVGEEPLPAAVSNYSCDDSLRILLGDPTVTCDDYAQADSIWQDLIWQQDSLESDSLETLSTQAAPYDTTTPPHPLTDPEGCYLFGGRDIVFVHGNRMDPLFERLLNLNTDASIKWHTVTQFPGSIENPAFYGNGYWKAGAERYWADHIQRYLTSRGIKNRYVIVAWPATQRMRHGLRAMLTQIGDAMTYGTGVKNPADPSDTAGFGANGYVVISHSAGTLLTDIAMASALSKPNLHAQYVANYCKAHIALDGALSGSSYATDIVMAAGYVTVHPVTLPTWLCSSIQATIFALDGLGSPNYQISCPLSTQYFRRLAVSEVVDLVPMVAQLRWGPVIRNSQVRFPTIVNSGGTPTFLAPFKHLLLPGFDDGVMTVNGQSANPNLKLLWPSGFRPAGGYFESLLKTFDRGVWQAHPIRAVGFYIDQVVDKKFNLPGSLLAFPKPLVAGGPALITPTGMIPSIGREYNLTNGYNPKNRYPKHYSYILSACDHFGGALGEPYRSSFGEPNREESRCITDAGIYAAVPGPHGDLTPVLTPSDAAKVEILRRFKNWPVLFRRNSRRPPRVRWERNYALLQGYASKTQCDYIYESILKSPLALHCPPITDVTDPAITAPGRFAVSQAWPNPMRTSTLIRAAVPEGHRLSAAVFDVSGRLVRTISNRSAEAGEVDLSWDGHDDSARQVPNGLYFMKVTLDGPDGESENRYARVVVFR
jgi:hypothetical protein